jgi:DNA transformation protein
MEVFKSFGEIEMRRMFSGYGLFREGLMFGLVYDQLVYLKTDADNIAEFQKKGLGQFLYERGGKVRGLSYYRPPDSVMDDPGEAARWAHIAFEAALRAAASKAKEVRNRRQPRRKK